jgi:hypothetical protein
MIISFPTNIPPIQNSISPAIIMTGVMPSLVETGKFKNGITMSDA